MSKSTTTREPTKEHRDNIYHGGTLRTYRKPLKNVNNPQIDPHLNDSRRIWIQAEII